MEKSRFTTILYWVALAVASLIAYKLGALWVEKESAIAAEETPRTMPFQLEDGVTSAWDLSPFSLEDTEGTVRSLSDWKGKTILLNFWATWCPPCKQEIPDFIEYQDEYGREGLQIIGIGIDDAEKLKNFARTLEMNYPVLLASSPEMMFDWGNERQILPYSIVIDRSGQIRYIHRGQLSKLSFEHEVRPIILE